MTKAEIEKRIEERESHLKFCEWVVDDEGQPAQVVRGYLKEARECREEISLLRQQLVEMERSELTPEQFESIRARAKQAPKMGPVV